MKSLKYVLSIVALTGAFTFPASATFIKAPDPGGEKLFIDVANKDASDFEGFVGANNPSAPHVAIHTTGNVDTGSGFANIKPVKGGSLTELVFTPADPTLFGDFSFRGQLNAGANETVTVTVQDNSANGPQTFTFTGLGKNKDFGRIGIISLDGETIKSVTLTSDFKEVKQIEFSFAGAQVPDSGTTAMLLGGALAGLGLMRRYLKR
jgi:protein with PEP-CTERM/exosortase system signal